MWRQHIQPLERRVAEAGALHARACPGVAAPPRPERRVRKRTQQLLRSLGSPRNGHFTVVRSLAHNKDCLNDWVGSKQSSMVQCSPVCSAWAGMRHLNMCALMPSRAGPRESQPGRPAHIIAAWHALSLLRYVVTRWSCAARVCARVIRDSGASSRQDTALTACALAERVRALPAPSSARPRVCS